MTGFRRLISVNQAVNISAEPSALPIITSHGALCRASRRDG
jgi:hypothetical protein